jgi:hypothetical protein
MVVLALLAAAPKECKDDVKCFNPLAAKCEPVVYRWHGTQKMMGASATGTTSYVVHGLRDGKCQVEYLDVLESAEIDEKAIKAMMPQATPEQVAALKKKMLEGAQDKGRHFNCELEPSKVVEWVNANLPNHSEVDEHRYDDCTPTDCGPKPMLAKGCSFTACAKGGWHFTCGGSKKLECVFPADERVGEGVAAACVAGKDGKPAVMYGAGE